jgi:hypothetical protein
MRVCSIQRLFLLIALVAPLLISRPSAGQSPSFHTHTDWDLKPSLKYDTLCLLNALSGDPYYLHYYQSEYDHFQPLFTPTQQASFVELKRIFKDDGGGIISATLTLYYSTVPGETLNEMIETAKDSSRMEAALRKTAYWDEGGWKRYEAARPALITALTALNRVGFPAYWAETAKPRVEKRITELAPELLKYDIVPDIEKHLGFSLPSQRITVYLLNYSEPHGIRITGLRLLTHVSYPFTIVLHNAIHESMHPPYLMSDPAVARAVDLLGADPLVIDKVEHHNPSFGYNTTRGYIEEDSVQALEQIISEDFDAGRSPCSYWKQQDDGMHLLASAIYTDYRSAYAQEPQVYSRWLIRAVAEGQLRGGRLKGTVASFFTSGDCTR